MLNPYPFFQTKIIQNSFGKNEIGILSGAGIGIAVADKNNFFSVFS